MKPTILIIVLLTSVLGTVVSLNPSQVSAAPSCISPAPGLVSWWPLDGNANDLQNLNPGTVVGNGGQFVPAMVGSGFQSGGVGSLVEVKDAPSLTPSQFTINAWVKIFALTTSNMPIVWRGNNLGADITSSYSLSIFGNPGSFTFPPGTVFTGKPEVGKAFFMVDDGVTDQVLVSSAPITIGGFVHLAASADGSKMRLYVNGKVDVESNQVIKLQHSSFPFQIGGVSGTVTPGFFFDGVIDELQLHNRALAPAEVQSIYTADGQGVCKPAVPSGLPPFVGRVCLVPDDSTACPQTLPPMVADSKGQLTVSVNILGSTSFNASSIMLRWDPTIMNATSIDLTGTILPSPTVFAKCLNGIGGIALGCGSRDGPGIAHVDILGSTLTAPVSGRLFKVSFVGGAMTNLPIGFATGCTSANFGIAIGSDSIPNTDSCVAVGIVSTSVCATLCIVTFTPVPESIQSQLLGVRLPTGFRNDIPPGNLQGTTTSSQAVDTWIMPYQATMPGNITSWKAQFSGGTFTGTTLPTTPERVQIKVLRKTGPSTLTVVQSGPRHDPRVALKARLPGYPMGQSQTMVIQYLTDTLLTVQPGDYIGLTITSDPAVKAYNYPTTIFSGLARMVPRNVTLGGTIDLSDPFTGRSELTPALEVFVQQDPPRLDTAGDGIPDYVALSPEMQALGVDPCRKTVLVQLDYMESLILGYTHKPLPLALSNVTAAFDAAPVPAVPNCPYQGFPRKPSGINLILDVKNAIPQQDMLAFAHSQPQSFHTLRATYLDPNRIHYFHYGLFVHKLDPALTTSGVGEVYGSSFIVSLGDWPDNVGTVYEQAGTLMHEIGHNLGLQHGGGDEVNKKPNYLSVMSYSHQVTGIVSRTSTGDVTRFDFSREAMPALNETILNEWRVLSNAQDYTRWICPDHHTVKIDLVSNRLDWNCDGRLSKSVKSDLNNDTIFGALTGYNDWANLRFKFVESQNFDVGCAIGCDIGCAIGCDIGCAIGCDIGCAIGCDLGAELDRPTAAAIEASWAAFLASPHRSTTTGVSCNPASVIVNTPTVCTATVSNTDTGTSMNPTGTVSFLSSQLGTFTPDTCPLLVTGATATCSVNYSPATSSLGSQTITAGYTPDDTNHLGSDGSADVSGLELPMMMVATNTVLSSDVKARIIIGADQILLNCRGHTISGISTDPLAASPENSQNIGISLNNRLRVVIANCRITNFYVGIQLSSSMMNGLVNNTATGNSVGFRTSFSSFNFLVLNNATANSGDGYRLEYSGANALVGNVARNNLGSGFLLSTSSMNTLALNLANSNGKYGFALVSMSNSNKIIANAACMNASFDAFQDTTSTDDVYRNNLFCTSQGLPPPDNGG